MKLKLLASLIFLIPAALQAETETAPHLIEVKPGQIKPEEVLHKTDNWIESEKVILRGLDKISARVFTSEVYVNQKIHFGSLEIYVRSASRSPPEDQPESACFLEIYDNKSGQQRQKVFSGWMFASNPALSALEHPVYDIWVKDVVLPTQAGDAVVIDTAAVKPAPKVIEDELEDKSDTDLATGTESNVKTEKDMISGADADDDAPED